MWGETMDDNTKIIMKIAEDVSAIKAKIENYRDEVNELKVHVKNEVDELKTRVTVLEKNMYKILGAILIINGAISLIVPHFFK